MRRKNEKSGFVISDLYLEEKKLLSPLTLALDKLIVCLSVRSFVHSYPTQH